MVAAGVIHYTYIPGPHNRADALTKSVPAPAFELARTRWNVHPPSSTPASAPAPAACSACYKAKAFMVHRIKRPAPGEQSKRRIVIDDTSPVKLHRSLYGHGPTASFWAAINRSIWINLNHSSLAGANYGHDYPPPSHRRHSGWPLRTVAGALALALIFAVAVFAASTLACVANARPYMFDRDASFHAVPVVFDYMRGGGDAAWFGPGPPPLPFGAAQAA